MGSAGGPESGAIAAVSPGAGGVVPRVGLFGRLGARARVTVVSAPAGSGKTVLVRSWIGEAGVADRATWVPMGRDERDPQRFWALVLGALRGTAPGFGLVRELTAAPDPDGWAVVERLLKDLAPLAEPVWLVVDDVHLLGPDQALRQLELLMMRAPNALRFVLCTRRGLRLGLHRLRLEGEAATATPTRPSCTAPTPPGPAKPAPAPSPGPSPPKTPKGSAPTSPPTAACASSSPNWKPSPSNSPNGPHPSGTARSTGRPARLTREQHPAS